MGKSDNDKIEDDVMQALESLRAILDKDPVSTIKNADNIPTLNNIVETPIASPSKDNTMESLSLFDDISSTDPKTQRKAEEQLIFPQVSELDKHHSINPAEANAEPQANTSEPDFDEFWVLLEPKLKQAAKECFRQLLQQTNKRKKSSN